MPISGKKAHEAFVGTGFEIMAITGPHGITAGALPLLHADPFDRMLVAQAMAESLVLITSDKRLLAYHPGVIVV